MIFTTCLSANYAAKARVLAASVKRWHPAGRTVFCLVEKQPPAGLRPSPHIDEWVLARDLGWKNFGRLVAGHDRVEGVTLVKARLLQRLLERFPREKYFVYLDPDTLVCSPLAEVPGLLDRHGIILTPHLLEPGNLEMELSALNHGAYNLGFLGLRRAAETREFLDWWGGRLAYACYDDRPRGLFTDQKWMDLAPGFFNVFLLRDPGYNVATWALQERRLTRRGQRLYANGRPVRFLHFSGFDAKVYFWAVGRWAADSRDLALDLGRAYGQALREQGEERFAHLAWSYDFLDNGRKIAPWLRRALRWPQFAAEADPYAMSVRELKARLLPGQRWPRRWWRLVQAAMRAGRRRLAENGT